MRYIAAQRDSRGVPRVCGWVPRTHPTSHAHYHIALSPFSALVMPSSLDTLTELSMTLTWLSGTRSLRDALVAQLLGEVVASSPLAKARWSEVTEIGYPPPPPHLTRS